MKCGFCKERDVDKAHVRSHLKVPTPVGGGAVPDYPVAHPEFPSAKTVIKNGPVDLSEVPAGRYAVQPLEGQIAFYRIDKPTKGKWQGWTFVKILQGPNEQRVGSVPPGGGYKGTHVGNVAAIATDWKAALALYGHEIGHCGICSLRLTDEESRARGIGPICAGKVGW